MTYNLSSADPVGMSFWLISMALVAATAFFFIERDRVAGKWKTSLTVSGLVTLIAAVHYFYMRDVWVASGTSPTELRYIDWLLTVPLLLVEVIAVLALTREVSRSLIMRLVPASAAMIALGYPGAISNDQNTQVLYGVLSTLPFLYILYVLFVELGKSLDRQPAGVAETVGRLRLLLIATWGVYPIAYIFNIVGDASASSFVTVQVGYTIADVLAKCVFGLTILKIARMKSMAEGMKDDH